MSLYKLYKEIIIYCVFILCRKKIYSCLYNISISNNFFINIRYLFILILNEYNNKIFLFLFI